jgi:tetratricopeptide (TPR) repeat protein
VFAGSLLGAGQVVGGEYEAACETLERGLAAAEELGESLPLAAFIIDPVASMHVYLAIAFLHRGFADQARRHADVALERSVRIGQPMAGLLAQWLGGMIEVRLRHPDLVRQRGLALEKLLANHMLLQAEGPILWFRGLAEAQLGDPRQGLAWILEGYERRMRLGLRAGTTEVLGYVADALVLDRRWEPALEKVNEALRSVEECGEHALLPDLLLIRARIEAGLGNPQQAQATMREALRIARSQGALMDELNALVALVEFDNESTADVDALAAAYARVTEGFDTTNITGARLLLAALHR